MPEPYLQAVLPELAAEIAAGLERAGEAALAGQVPALRVLDHDRSAEAVAIYTEPRPAGAYGPDWRNVRLDVRKGTVVIDVVAGRIACLEVLSRGDVRARLRDFAERGQ